MADQTEDQQWHKALVLMFRKLGIVEMLITEDDMKPLNEMQPDDLPAMIAVSADDGIHLILSTNGEVKQFTEQQSLIMKPH